MFDVVSHQDHAGKLGWNTEHIRDQFLKALRCSNNDHNVAARYFTINLKSITNLNGEQEQSLLVDLVLVCFTF